jgi:hypothetical protein
MMSLAFGSEGQAASKILSFVNPIIFLSHHSCASACHHKPHRRPVKHLNLHRSAHSLAEVALWTCSHCNVFFYTCNNKKSGTSLPGHCLESHLLFPLPGHWLIKKITQTTGIKHQLVSCMTDLGFQTDGQRRVKRISGRRRLSGVDAGLDSSVVE